jgi:GNAT superfamily N-acetyltransferase
MTITISSAESEDQIQHVITLSQEYVTWMDEEVPQHYPELDLAELALEHGYDDIRKKFPGEHVPPYGRLYLAYSDDQAGGCIALGKLTKTVCEMRTLFVRPEFRGMGMGKKLAQTVIQDARHIGYSHMRLDTLGFMSSAQKLYRSLGFYNIAPYIDVSESLKKRICFFEVDLRV